MTLPKLEPLTAVGATPKLVKHKGMKQQGCRDNCLGKVTTHGVSHLKAKQECQNQKSNLDYTNDGDFTLNRFPFGYVVHAISEI